MEIFFVAEEDDAVHLAGTKMAKLHEPERNRTKGRTARLKRCRGCEPFAAHEKDLGMDTDTERPPNDKEHRSRA